MKKKILIVEDDSLIAELERDYLEANDFEAELARDGYDGLRLAREKDYDLILLDVMLPNISGFDICRELRREKSVPIMMVTAKKSDVDKIRVWGMDALGDTDTVTVHVNRIRSRIEKDSSDPEYIETVWGAGYRLRLPS